MALFLLKPRPGYRLQVTGCRLRGWLCFVVARGKGRKKKGVKSRRKGKFPPAWSRSGWSKSGGWAGG